MVSVPYCELSSSRTLALPRCAPRVSEYASAPALVVRGLVERQGEVINIRAERVEAMDLAVPMRSRDFR